MGSATPNKVILTHSTPDEGCFVFMPCYSYNYISLSNCKLKMTELVIKGMELGRNSK